MAGNIKFKGGVAFSENADAEAVVFEGDADAIIADKAEVAALTTVAASDAVVTAVVDAVAAAGEAPTDDEFDAVVALANDLKAKYNAAVTLINELKSDLNAVVTALKA